MAGAQLAVHGRRRAQQSRRHGRCSRHASRWLVRTARRFPHLPPPTRGRCLGDLRPDRGVRYRERVLSSRGWSVAVVVAVLAIALRAHADGGRRVVLIDPDRALRDAVRTTLSPWALSVETAAGPAPDPSMPGSGDRARALADDHGAVAVLWITDSADGPALWAYDREDDRVAVRRLGSPPPFDAATAAAVALSIKTLLRHSAAAPEDERYGADATPPPRFALPGPEVRGMVRLEAGASARHGDTGAEATSLRLGLGAAWSPRATRRRLELAARVEIGSRLEARGDDFVGQLSDLTLSARARVPLLLRPRLALVPFAGASLHATEISGSIPSEQAPASAGHVNPSLDGGALLRWAVSPRLELAATAELSWVLRRQRYLVRGAPVFELPPVEAELGVTVSFPFATGM